MLTYRIRRRLVETAVSAQRRAHRLRVVVPAEVLRMVDGDPGHREVARHRDQFVVARRQDVVTIWHLAAHTADRVGSVLTDASVEYFAMHRPFTGTTRWGVRRDQLPGVVSALARTLGSEAFYYQFDKTAPPRLVRDRK